MHDGRLCMAWIGGIQYSFLRLGTLRRGLVLVQDFTGQKERCWTPAAIAPSAR